MSQSNRQGVLDFFNKFQSGIQVYPAEIRSVETNTCTVRILSSDLEVEGVKLIADSDASEKVVFYPRVGSTVLVGCIENELSSLYVAQCTEIDGFDLIIGDSAIGGDKNMMLMKSSKTFVSVEKNKLSIAQDGVEITLANKKVSIKNSTVNLKTLFSDLTTLLKTFVVITSTGPSTAVSPASLLSITQLETKVNQLLS
jgi:hypothetical protein